MGAQKQTKPQSHKQTYSADSPKPVFIKAPPAPGPVYLDPPNPVYAQPEVKKTPSAYKKPEYKRIDQPSKKQTYSTQKKPVAPKKPPTYQPQPPKKQAYKAPEKKKEVYKAPEQKKPVN